VHLAHEQFPSPHFWHESPQLRRGGGQRETEGLEERYTYSHDLDSTLFGQFLQVHLAHEQSPSEHFLQASPQLRANNWLMRKISRLLVSAKTYSQPEDDDLLGHPSHEQLEHEQSLPLPHFLQESPHLENNSFSLSSR
jgi:hypothetical protein